MELKIYGPVEPKKAAPGLEDELGKQSAKHRREDNEALIWAGRERLDRPNAASPVALWARPWSNWAEEQEKMKSEIWTSGP